MFNKFPYFLYVHTLFRSILLGYSVTNKDHKKHLLSEFKTLIVQCLFAMFGGVGICAPMQWTKFCDGDGEIHYPFHLIPASTTVKVFDLITEISSGRIYIDLWVGTVDYFGLGAEITHDRLLRGMVVDLAAKQYINSELHTNRSQLRSSMFNSFLNLLGVCVQEPTNSCVICVRYRSRR